MTAMYLVQKGVPMPPINRRPRERRRYPVDTMVVDEFFFVPGGTPRSISSYVSRITKDLPGKFGTRHVWAWKDARDGVWRVCAASASGAVEGVGIWRKS